MPNRSDTNSQEEPEVEVGKRETPADHPPTPPPQFYSQASGSLIASRTLVVSGPVAAGGALRP